ncbi:hypothetical protein QBC46DRAFT_436246 [Diplogelasinospora grovesii]|uniref:Uncharacterized protein n=1 Tax=Diplogelasinospora grovesii TaxID=303347 RepID=A0AAN6N7Q8_9PEZI|nr:hypothetical protein QBC46DRAFT_436246 [Diplogelasinospora grovesii]
MLSWSWANTLEKVKHVWPANATVQAKVIDYQAQTNPPWSSLNRGYIIIRGAFAALEPVGGPLSSWTDDIEVNVRAGGDYITKLRIRYFLDYDYGYDDPGGSRLPVIYGLKITRRVALLLTHHYPGSDKMERVGLMIIAKPDAHKWGTDIGQREVTIF